MRVWVSSSIANFKEKILKKTGLQEWTWDTRNEDTLFVGMYHWGDWKRFRATKGKRTIIWCGSDILHVKNNSRTPWFLKLLPWRRLIGFHKAKNICENIVEQKALKEMGIDAEIRYIFWGDVNKYPVSYKHSDRPQVWMTAHPGREKEYGVDLIVEIAKKIPEVIFHVYGVSKPFLEDYPWGRSWDNEMVIFHGIVSEEKLDEEIKGYQGSVRLNEFDGFAEVLAKSILLGQYPISRIPYPFIQQCKNEEELIQQLKNLSTYKQPNYKSREYLLKNIS